VWRIAPPLTVTREDIDLAMTIFDQALTEMKAVVAKRSGASGAAVRAPRVATAPMPRGQSSTRQGTQAPD
jgi:hypothetical protein